MVQIPLTRGYVAVVDDQDAHLAKYKWHAHESNGKMYAARRRKKSDPPGACLIRLHNEVLSIPDGTEVDHQDGDTMNCRRCNLRPATHLQNMQNRNMYQNNTSGFRGVVRYHDKRSGLSYWKAQIKMSGKHKSLGYYQDVVVAARAYDKAARRLLGEFARLNFPETKP